MKYHLPLTHPLLQTVDISVSFGGLQILDDVSIGIPEGSVTGLIGPNGAGKPTVFNVMTGFVKPDSGKVKYEGNRLRHVKTHHLTKMGISRTLQGVGLFPSLTARENVMLGASGHVRSGIVADALAMPWTDAEQRHVREKAEAAMAAEAARKAEVERAAAAAAAVLEASVQRVTTYIGSLSMSPCTDPRLGFAVAVNGSDASPAVGCRHLYSLRGLRLGFAVFVTAASAAALAAAVSANAGSMRIASSR